MYLQNIWFRIPPEKYVPFFSILAYEIQTYTSHVAYKGWCNNHTFLEFLQLFKQQNKIVIQVKKTDGYFNTRVCKLSELHCPLFIPPGDFITGGELSEEVLIYKYCKLNNLKINRIEWRYKIVSNNWML